MTDETVKNARTLRRNQTDAEKLLWSKLRNAQLHDFKFRRQHPFPPYILDFYCDDLNLVIELDGGQHNEEKDKERTRFLNEEGLTISRYWNNDVLKNIDGVLEDIANKVNIPSPQPSPQGEGVHRICIAKVATAHGIKGLVKLHIFADDETLATGKLFTSESGDKTLSLTLKNQTAKHWLAEIEGITDRTDAEKLRGTELYIDETSLPDIDNDDEFYIADLLGLPCIDTSNKHIGKIITVENFGASDLLEIQPDGDESFYVPFTDDTILEITDTTVTIEIPEGLLD